MFVKTIQLGFYDNKRRYPEDPESGREADIFKLRPRKGIGRDGKPITISAESQFAPSWMAKIVESQVTQLDKLTAEEQAERLRIQESRAKEEVEITAIRKREAEGATITESPPEETATTTGPTGGEGSQDPSDPAGNGGKGTGETEVLE